MVVLLYKQVKPLLFFALALCIFIFSHGLAYASQVTLAWDESNTPLDGYQVFQRVEGQAYDYSRPKWTGNDNTCTIDNLIDDTTYYFVVRACKGEIVSDNSNEVEHFYSSPNKDSDGDGIIDTEDDFPFDSREWVDTDGDGTGNNSDADDDNDGMDDIWENTHGLNPLVNDANHDLDGDGLLNIEEYELGSNPTRPDDNWSTVIDDGDAGTSTTGQWIRSGGLNPYGSQSLYSKEVGANYIYEMKLSGRHEIALWWSEHSSRCTNVPVKIFDGDTLLDTIYVNQQENAGQWNSLGKFRFTGNAKVVIVSEDSGCSTSADAVEINELSDEPMIIDDGEPGTFSTGQWIRSGGLHPYGSQSVYSKEVGANYRYETKVSGRHEIALWWSKFSSRCSNVPVMIYDGDTLLDTVYVNQQENAGQWNRLGSYRFTGDAKVVVVSEDSSCSTSADAVEIKAASDEPMVIDDGDPGTASTGGWSISGGLNPYGSQSVYSKGAGANYSYESALSGRHELLVWWSAYSTRCTNVPVQIYDGDALIGTKYVNQQENAGQWNSLGYFNFTDHASVVVVSEDSSCSTSADAIGLF
ncbi:MAG: hypothetical protein HKM93_11365 [Desulfobacteraceae bacterium]|nr:hypothetical protein [Desulfobacteraceae bacterium]